MKTITNVSFALVALLCVAVSGGASAQTIDGPGSCGGIGGIWSAANPPQRENRPVQRYGRCTLHSSYIARAPQNFFIAPGVEMVIGISGVLVNEGYLEIPNTAALIIAEGELHNTGHVYADNSGELWFFSGRFENLPEGEIEIEGDFFTEPLPHGAPQGRNDCANNRGLMHFYSGGNVHNRGCIDNFSLGFNDPGTFNVLRDGTFHNHTTGLHRTGLSDIIAGTFINYATAYLENVGRTVVQHDGSITNNGRISIAREYLLLNAGTSMTTNSSGEVTLDGGDMYVHGIYTSNGGSIFGSRRGTFTVGGDGEFYFNGGSRAWANGQVDVVNNGLILSDCVVFWYPPRSFTGRDLMRKRCGPPVPIKPRPIFPF
ncbi:MAG: hypothetical protein AAFO81_00780 [Pseudomonadota bacterium]